MEFQRKSLKRACFPLLRTLYRTGYVTNELAYAENMEKLGSVALSREAEAGIGKILQDHLYVLK